jgi:hypothetical protein
VPETLHVKLAPAKWPVALDEWPPVDVGDEPPRVVQRKIHAKAVERVQLWDGRYIDVSDILDTRIDEDGRYIGTVDRRMQRDDTSIRLTRPPRRQTHPGYQ